jgi:TnpA family transposase
MAFSNSVCRLIRCKASCVLNRGEAVNALKRAIYVGRVASYQAKQHEEMQAMADALSLLANLVMAWNTMRGALDFAAITPGRISR